MKIGRYMLTFLLFGVTAINSSTAQITPDAVAAKLSGSSTKTWIFRRFESLQTLGSPCVDGEEWVFTRNTKKPSIGTLEINKCVDFNIKTNKYKWSLKQKGTDITLEIQGFKSYIVIFPKLDSKSPETLILRIYSKDVSVPTVDRVMTFDKTEL